MNVIQHTFSIYNYEIEMQPSLLTSHDLPLYYVQRAETK